MTAPSDGPLDPRVAELLSAGLDDALDADERPVADAWLERSAAARAERDQLLAVKAALAALPPVEPPAGFFESLLERGSPRPAAVSTPLRRRWGHSPVGLAVSGLATAAAWIVVAGVDVDEVRPPLDGVEAAALDIVALRPANVDDMPVVRAGRLELVDALRHDGEAVAVLEDRGGRRVAVLRQEGPVDWDDLPTGDRGRHDDAATWVDLSADPGVARVVVVRAGAVYTLVSADVGADMLVELGSELPAGDGDTAGGGWTGRARRACDALVDAFSLD